MNESSSVPVRCAACPPRLPPPRSPRPSAGRPPPHPRPRPARGPLGAGVPRRLPPRPALDLGGATAWTYGPLYAVAYASGGWEPALEGLRALREKTLDVDLLMIVAALGAAAIGQVLDGGLLIVIFATSGALEALATARTADSVRGLLDLAPTTATRLREGGEETVPTADLAVGDLVLVRPGSGSAPTAPSSRAPERSTRPPSPASPCPSSSAPATTSSPAPSTAPARCASASGATRPTRSSPGSSPWSRRRPAPRRRPSCSSRRSSSATRSGWSSPPSRSSASRSPSAPASPTPCCAP